MSRALTFLNDPQLAQSVLPVPGTGLDIPAFLAQSGTLYLIAESRNDDSSPVAALFACLANEVRFTAELIGSKMPGGRLDPPLLMALDEIVQTCPVPLPSWLSRRRRQGHPNPDRHPRHRPAAVPLAAQRRAGHPRHLRHPNLAARHHRHRHPGQGQQAVRPGRAVRAHPPAPPVRESRPVFRG